MSTVLLVLLGVVVLLVLVQLATRLRDGSFERDPHDRRSSRGSFAAWGGGGSDRGADRGHGGSDGGGGGGGGGGG